MRHTLDELVKDLADIRTLTSSIEPVNSALADHNDALVRQYVLVRRRFDYAAFIVALYASFEKFIESLIAAYAKLESQRVPYAELPERLIVKHRVKTAEMLNRGRIGEGRYVGTTELEVVKNLYECINGTRPYRLNEAAVVAHDVNLRAVELDSVFIAMGIDGVCSSVRRADALLEWHRDAAQLDATPEDGVPVTTIETRLNDIVERRNAVAHRGGNPDDLLGPVQMRESINFIEALAKSVFARVVGAYLQNRYVAPSAGITLPQREGDGPYNNDTIVIVERPDHRLFTNQPLFLLSDSMIARWGRIQSLRLDDNDVAAVEPLDVAPSGVGIRLDFRCPAGRTLVALPAEDELVWSPSGG